MTRSVALMMRNISKSFGGVAVLKDVSFQVRSSEVHALLGENGAGKSVLMKILMGVHRPDGGNYIVGGKDVQFANPAQAQQNRVSMVYQEFGLVQHMSVTENIFMDRLPTRWGTIQWAAARRRAAEVLRRLGSQVSPDATVGELKIADQQEVEIARALSYDPLVFIMDEPSSTLSRVEVARLYTLVRGLRARGVAVIYISHKLEEVFALADSVTIIRDGAVVGTYPAAELNPSSIVEKMTGKPIGNHAPRGEEAMVGNEAFLTVDEVTVGGVVENVSLAVGRGTVVGVAGVIGAGKSELARAIVGALPSGTIVTGRMRIGAVSVDLSRMSPDRARRLGIGFVSESRQAEGIVADHSVLSNILLPALGSVTTGLTLIRQRCRKLVRSIMDEILLRPRDPDKLVALLSGGNQQKVVIGKWLAAGSRLLILDEPTRGIDVGAREEIYSLIRNQARERGLAVLLLSSDLREILIASDVILVMNKGRVTHKVLPRATNEQDLLDMVLGERDRKSSIASIAFGEGLA
jgi:ABC-type sugar transport system ATPase subunit